MTDSSTSNAPSFAANAPDMGAAFDRVHDVTETAEQSAAASREEFLTERAFEAGLDQDGYSQIATRSELDQRIAERPELQPAPALTPGGALETQVHLEVDAEHEKRIFLLQRQLESQRGAPTREFTRNR